MAAVKPDWFLTKCLIQNCTANLSTPFTLKEFRQMLLAPYPFWCIHTRRTRTYRSTFLVVPKIFNSTIIWSNTLVILVSFQHFRMMVYRRKTYAVRIRIFWEVVKVGLDRSYILLCTPRLVCIPHLRCMSENSSHFTLNFWNPKSKFIPTKLLGRIEAIHFLLIQLKPIYQE